MKERSVSASPTRPDAGKYRGHFDIARFYQGPLDVGQAQTGPAALDEKFRQACFRLVNHGIISPFYNMEYNREPPAE